MSLKEILKDAQGVPTGEYKRIAGGTLWADSPIGTILAFGGADAPAGWMICDGTSLLRASYPELFAVIGTAFGSVDSTHFNIPDMRESVPKGAGLTGHTVGAHLDADGLAVGEFLDDRVQEHKHGLEFNRTLTTAQGNHATASYYAPEATGMSTGRSGDTTEVKSVGVNYIIKAKMVALPADFMDALNDKQDATDNNLQTTDKTIVGAINEVDAEVGALQTSVSNKLQLYSYEITDKLTDANGNMPCGYISSLGIPINFKPYNVNNYPCNAFIDQAGMIYVRPLNNTWGINDYGSVANFNLKGTLYCVK